MVWGYGYWVRLGLGDSWLIDSFTPHVLFLLITWSTKRRFNKNLIALGKKMRRRLFLKDKLSHYFTLKCSHTHLFTSLTSFGTFKVTRSCITQLLTARSRSATHIAHSFIAALSAVGCLQNTDPQVSSDSQSWWQVSLVTHFKSHCPWSRHFCSHDLS